MKSLIIMAALAVAAVVSLSACSTVNDKDKPGTSYTNNVSPQSTVPFPDAPATSTTTEGPIPNAAGSGNQPETPAQ